MDNQIKSHIKRLEKIEVTGIEKPKEEIKVLFQIDESKKIGSVVVQAKDISKNLIIVFYLKNLLSILSIKKRLVYMELMVVESQL